MNQEVIRHIVIDELEIEGFIDGSSGKVQAAWALNDANWRSEYMDHLIQSLGIKIVHVKGTARERANIAKEFGFELT